MDVEATDSVRNYAKDSQCFIKKRVNKTEDSFYLRTRSLITLFDNVNGAMTIDNAHTTKRLETVCDQMVSYLIF